MNYEDPISKLRVLTAKKTKKYKMISGDYNIVVPKKFEIVNFTFGRPVKNRIMCYKRKTNLLQQAFSPVVRDRYPLENHDYAEFPEAVSMFCFPEGVFFKRDNIPPTSFSFILTQ